MNLGKIAIFQTIDEIFEQHISGILSRKTRERVRQLAYADLTQYE